MSEIRAEDSISQISSHYPKPDAKLADPRSRAGTESHASSRIDVDLGSHANTRTHASPRIDVCPRSHASPRSRASIRSHAGSGSHASFESKASSVMRLNEATEKRELARLKLQQLQKLQELELKKLRVKGEEDTLKLQNEYEQAVLSERIWGQAEEVISREEKQELPLSLSDEVWCLKSCLHVYRCCCNATGQYEKR